MEIVSTTSSYISSISAAYKKAYNNTGKVGSQLSISSKESMTNDPLAYYKQLCSKYPNISFRLDDYFNGTNAKGYNLGYNNSMNQVGENFGEMGQCSIEIDISVIEKMMQDPKYEQQANGWIQAFEQNYAGHAADVASSGCSNFCFTIHDFGDGIQTGRTCGYTPFSTEEEVRKMWADEEYQKSVSQVFDKQKADLIEIYLKMTESCILKKDELAPSEQSKEEQRIENISKATQQVEDEYEYAISKHDKIEGVDIADVSNDRKGIGLTSFPVSSMTSALVGAYIPKESTEQDPIIQVDYKVNGERHVYNIHVNDVDPTNASDMEMFAYLTYQGYIGNRIPGAINNWDAYKTIRREDELDTYGEFKQLLGEKYFTSTKSNAIAMIERVYSWMKNINHSDAKVQAGWCEDLLAMLNPVNDTLENYV